VSQADIKTDSETGQSKATFDDESSVESVTIDSDLEEGPVSVSELSREPESTGPAPGLSVSVMEITVPENAADSPGIVRTRVSRERLESIIAEPENLRLSRHADGRWQSLDTTVAEVTDERVILKAETPGFSYFAVNAVGELTAKIDAPSRVDAGDELRLDASGSTTEYGKIVAYKWTVGEASHTGKSVAFTVSNPGEITIELTVETDKGETDSTTYTILVDNLDSETGDVGLSDTGNGSDASTPEDGSGSPDDEIPGFEIVTALVSLLAALLAVIRREHN
jgi:PGF-pre-PGF domain-containing protein/PGF-CTERM protein